ncbi:Transmembrane GTPase Marf [Lucilia cuprina]|nr:Transmembrane GTPase Marf [Lucilia cuprina]
MAAYLNRTLSVVTGNGGNAALNAEADIVDKAERELSWYTRVLARDHMKVAFFVRTSNGKSSVINAMLREKILPSGIGHTTNCFCQKKLSESSLVRIFWPRERCSLLRDDVVFVDSPGVDVSANLDDWIDNHCLNADVFVLYPQKLSKPNIFILNNRWDASAHEPESQESARIEEAKGNSPSQGALAEGFQMRYFEFQDFERKFEECISKSAVQTKFEKHSSRGKTLSGDMRSMLDNIFERITIFRNLKVDQKTLLTERIQGTETEMMNVTREMKLKIHNMVEEVEQKVSKALNEEIWRLAGLGSNLRARLSMALAMNVEAAQREMTERMHALLPNEKLIPPTKIVARSQPFEMLYSLNCQNLCADFQEDLEFKFSWGITAMIQRFTGKVRERNNYKKQPAIMNRQGSVVQNPISPISPVGDTPLCLIPTPVGNITQEQLSIISRFALTSIGSQGTVGGLIVAGIMLKTIGWRVLVGVGALYGCIYLYERLSWTNSAKERAFKAQYVRHATKKLKMIVDLTSANCSHQVQQELSSTFARLCRTVDTATTDMNEELKTLEGQLAILEANQKQLKLLRNKANYIQNELEIFENNYIASN